MGCDRWRDVCKGIVLAAALAAGGCVQVTAGLEPPPAGAAPPSPPALAVAARGEATPPPVALAAAGDWPRPTPAAALRPAAILPATSVTTPPPLRRPLAAVPQLAAGRPDRDRLLAMAPRAGLIRRHLATLQFESSSAQLAADAHAVLAAVAQLRQTEGGTVRIVGHADHEAAGDASGAVHQRLARDRARAARVALEGLGLSRSAVITEARGDREPLSPPEGWGLAGNRRAEVYLESPAMRPAPVLAAATADIAGDAPYGEGDEDRPEEDAGPALTLAARAEPVGDTVTAAGSATVAESTGPESTGLEPTGLAPAAAEPVVDAPATADPVIAAAADPATSPQAETADGVAAPTIDPAIADAAVAEDAGSFVAAGSPEDDPGAALAGTAGDPDAPPGEQVAAVPPPAAAGPLPIATLYFNHASTRLGAAERAIVAAIATWQRQLGLTLTVVGHASAASHFDRPASEIDRTNRAIALARAEAVARRLVSAGVSDAHLQVLGRGSEEPVCAEDTVAGEAGNRRVEIYVDLPGSLRLADRGEVFRR